MKNFRRDDDTASVLRRKRYINLVSASLIAGLFFVAPWVMGTGTVVDGLTDYDNVFSVTTGVRNLAGGSQQGELVTGHFNGMNTYSLARSGTLTSSVSTPDYNHVGGLVNGPCCAAPNMVTAESGNTMWAATAGNPPPGTEGTTDYFFQIDQNGNSAGFGMFDESQGSTGSPKIFEGAGTIQAILSDFSADALLIYHGDPSTSFTQYQVIPNVDAPFGGAPFHHDVWKDKGSPNRGVIAGTSGSNVFLQFWDLSTGATGTRQSLGTVSSPLGGLYYIRGATNSDGMTVVGVPNPVANQHDFHCVDGGMVSTATILGATPDFWSLYPDGAHFGFRRPESGGGGVERGWVNCGDVSNPPVVWSEIEPDAPAPGYHDAPIITNTLAVTATIDFVGFNVHEPNNRQPDRGLSNDLISISVIPSVGFFDTLETGNLDSWSHQVGR